MATTSTEGGSTSQSVHDTESASDVALSHHQHSESSDQEENEDGSNKLTRKWLLKFLSKDWKHYYRTFELNEKLYLHFKGFTKFNCMELFPQLKTLYFEGNGLSEISGLENNGELRCLYVHENCISVMQGLDSQTKLANLNLSDNLITVIEGLSNCESLDMLYLARNRVGRNGIDDLRGLLECPSITTLDVQNCKIDDPDVLEEIFVKMPNLKVLYLQGNTVTSKIKNYRKTMIAKLPDLKYLDDRPVFVDDRRNAEAFARGGLEEERQERQRIQEEKRERDNQNRASFKEMIRKAREEKRVADEKAAAESSAQPAENKYENTDSEDETAPTTKINTCEEQKSAKGNESEGDNELPPELETVDADQLKEEQAKLSSADKQQRQIYEQMRKNDPKPKKTQVAATAEENDDEGCTVEEVADEPRVQEVVEEAKVESPESLDQIDQLSKMVSQINVEPEQEYVSNLEELD